MKTVVFFICSLFLSGSLLAQPVPAGPKPVATFQSSMTRLNTTTFFPATPVPAIASRINWLSDLDADHTVAAPTFVVKACVTSPKPITRYVFFLNDILQPVARDLKVEQDKDCPQTFTRTIQLTEGENKLKLVAYQTGGGEVAASLIVNYKKPVAVVLEKRLALVIGNASYSGSNKLGNPLNDANDMANALQSVGFEVMRYTDADGRTMRRAIDEFGNKLKDYQVGLFYYAGHGVQSKGHNFLVPIDAKPESENEIEYDCLMADRILTKMEDARTRTNIVVLDACRNNPFERSWSRGGGDNGLTTMDAPVGSVIAYATAPGKTAADGNGRNGLYTAALLKVLQMPNQPLSQLFQRVRAEVLKQSNNKQLPWESTSLTGDFYFLRK